jgi:hypothetical protein
MRTAALLQLAGALVIASTPACHAFYAVSGKVVTCDTHAPIANAEVRVDVPEIERKGKTTTDERGEFLVAVNYPPAALASELSVSKPGYTPSRLEVKDPNVRQQVCLKPGQQATQR